MAGSSPNPLPDRWEIPHPPNPAFERIESLEDRVMEAENRVRIIDKAVETIGSQSRTIELQSRTIREVGGILEDTAQMLELWHVLHGDQAMVTLAQKLRETRRVLDLGLVAVEGRHGAA